MLASNIRIIVQIFEVGETNQVPYLALEFCGGGNLSQLATEVTSQGLLEPKQIAQWLIPVCDAIDAAHQAGIIHRDLKPANLLLSDRGELKVGDFGLAKSIHHDSQTTLVGSLVGTPSYMAPEQCRGSEATFASDVFSLGSILYELLTGHVPFKGSNVAQTIQMVQQLEPVPPRRINPSLPRDIETICMKCLRKEPSQRYETAAVLRDDLVAFLDHRPIQARPPSRFEVVVKTLQRNRESVVAYALLVAAIALTITWGMIYRRAASQEAQQQRRQLEAHGHAYAIALADISQLPRLFEWPQDQDAEIVNELRSLWQQSAEVSVMQATSGALEPTRRLNLGLALVADDSHLQAELWTELLQGTPQQVRVIGNRLASVIPDFHEQCTRQLGSPQLSKNQKFHIACCLAMLGEFDVPPSIVDLIVTQLLAVSPTEFGQWSGLLSPVLPQLVNPLWLVMEQQNRAQQQRSYAADLLAQTYRQEPEVLFKLLLLSSPAEFSLVHQTLLGVKPEVMAFAENRMRQAFDDNNRSELALRKDSLAGVFLAVEGKLDWTVRSFQQTEDPRLASYLIDVFSQYDVPVRYVWNRLLGEMDREIRFGLLSCLAEYDRASLPAEETAGWIDLLKRWYQDDPDAGIHAVTELVLRRWQIELPIAIQPFHTDRAENRSWFINRQQQTFVILDAGEFCMGSPSHETDRDLDEQQHHHGIQRWFAIRTTEVTRGDFLKWQPDFPISGLGDRNDLDRPVGSIDWYTAAGYCNWLSEQDGIPKDQWCYAPNDAGQYAEGMSAAPDGLQRTGYRLPTEAEWEFACRALSRTSRYYGDSDSLLAKYAWYTPIANDRTHPVGMLLPNRFGLFDMLGNLYEWCHNTYERYPEPQPDGSLARSTDPLAASLIMRNDQRRALRGGSYDYSARHCRSAYRTNDNLDFIVSNDGFRPVRTIRK